MSWARRSSSSKLSPTMLYVLGAAAALIGLFMGLGRASFAVSGAHARGEIVDLRTVSSGVGRRRGHSTYADVRFTDSRGGAHTFHAQLQDGFGGWHLHESVDVVYPAGSPQLAQVGGFQNQWATPMVLLFGGLVAIGVGWFRSKDAEK